MGRCGVDLPRRGGRRVFVAAAMSLTRHTPCRVRLFRSKTCGPHVFTAQYAAQIAAQGETSPTQTIIL